MKPLWVLILATMLALQAQAQTVEIPARPGIVMKALVLKAPESKATLLMFAGGHTSGDACGASAFHGFNGLETQVIRTISEWIVAR